MTQHDPFSGRAGPPSRPVTPPTTPDRPRGGSLFGVVVTVLAVTGAGILIYWLAVIIGFLRALNLI